MNIFIAILLFFILSCKKQPINNPPEISIILPVEQSVYSALDTVFIRLNVRDNDSKNINLSIFLEKKDFTPITNNTLLYTFNKNEIQIDIPFALTDRWINSDEYYLTVTAYDGYSKSQARKKIFIHAIPKKFKGIMAGVKNQSFVDIYVSDTSFNFQKVFSLNNLLTGFYEYRFSLFASIHTNGVANFYTYPNFSLIKEISGLNKIGTPFRIDWKFQSPYLYITNANKSIIAIDKDGIIRKNISTKFSPYKINYFNNEWVVLSEVYPYPISYIEAPFQQKNYLKQGNLIDIIYLDNNRWLVVEQKNNQILLYEYKSLYNILNQFNHNIYGTYYGNLILNNKIILFIDNKIFELNKIYGTLFLLYQNNCSISQIKYEETKDLITGVFENSLCFIKNNLYSHNFSVYLPGNIVFYDFIYE